MSAPDDDGMKMLLRAFFAAYRERALAVAPRLSGLSPLLDSPRVDIVMVNGGRAIHVVCSTRAEPTVDAGSARHHDITLWPPATADLKQQASQDAERHRAQVRRTAEIGGTLLTHVILFPEDGQMSDRMADAGIQQADEDMARLRKATNGSWLGEDVMRR